MSDKEKLDVVELRLAESKANNWKILNELKDLQRTLENDHQYYYCHAINKIILQIDDVW